MQITIDIKELKESELTATQQRLLTQAKAATYRSYAPYSQFHVGAAVLLGDGTIVTGNNQENCAYPSGLCAERTAMFYANSQYPQQPVTCICIAARDTEGNFTRQPIAPCGACRQVLLETEKRFGTPISILLYGTEGCYIIPDAQSLLPVTFDSSFL